MGGRSDGSTVLLNRSGAKEPHSFEPHFPRDVVELECFRTNLPALPVPGCWHYVCDLLHFSSSAAFGARQHNLSSTRKIVALQWECASRSLIIHVISTFLPFSPSVWRNGLSLVRGTPGRAENSH